jgi:5'-3' exonuclease
MRVIKLGQGMFSQNASSKRWRSANPEMVKAQRQKNKNKSAMIQSKTEIGEDIDPNGTNGIP